MKTRSIFLLCSVFLSLFTLTGCEPTSRDIDRAIEDMYPGGNYVVYMPNSPGHVARAVVFSQTDKIVFVVWNGILYHRTEHTFNAPVRL